jgi:GAF domain-containing protein
MKMTHLSHRFLTAVLRMTRASQHTLSNVAARFSTGAQAVQTGGAPPDHVVMRLEGVFEALSDLSAQPHIAAALDLACDALQAELPTAVMAAGLYDIDSDEVRIVAARGAEHELLCGAAMPRARCLVGYATEGAVIAAGDAHGSDWLGGGGQDTTVLLCPIRKDANLLGVLALAEPLRADDFDHYDLELVGYVADRLSSFIQAHRHSALAQNPAC